MSMKESGRRKRVTEEYLDEEDKLGEEGFSTKVKKKATGCPWIKSSQVYRQGFCKKV